MKKLLICLLFITTILPIGYSQSDFQNGFVQLTQQDTLYGKIDNRSYYENAQSCFFQKNGSDSIIEYKPGQIYGYQFTNGKYYVTKEVIIDNQKQICFMEYLIKGKLDVYFYQDNDRINHYFVSKDTIPLRELIHGDFIKQIDGTYYHGETKRYEYLLDYLTSDCPDIHKDISRLRDPDHKNLISLAKKYHKLTCGDENCIVYEKKIPYKIKLVLSGGEIFSLNTLDLDKNKYTEYGFKILFQMPQKNEHLFWGVGLYRTPNFESGFKDGYQIPISFYYLNPHAGLRTIITYEVDLNMICLSQTLGFGLNYNMKDISCFLTANVKTFFIVYPYATSLNFGITYNLR